MLSILRAAGSPDGRLDLDNLTVSVEWPAASSEPPYYWRTGDFRRSLLEIGLHPATGQLISIGLILVDELRAWSTVLPDLNIIPERIENSVPICDRARWSDTNRFVDEIGALDVWLGTNRLLLRFGEADSQRSIQSGQVQFGITQQGDLAAIQINNLTNSDVSAIRHMFAR
jgi:hypothetical protein